MKCGEIIHTKLQKGKPKTTLEKRIKRIEEAIRWQGGTIQNPRPYTIATLEDDTEILFLKPGKEINNIRRPNPNDMTPVIGDSDERLRFDEIWTYLSKISVIDFDIFKAVLTLIYRNAYMMDHKEIKTDCIRYLPEKKIVDCIKDMDSVIHDILPHGLKGMLLFLDILGWNEDVKYHTIDGEPTFDRGYEFKVGRINTLLTCIRVPYEASSFVRHVISKTNTRKDIDFQLLYTIMQQFANSRGTCTPTQTNLVNWLSPYITKI